MHKHKKTLKEKKLADLRRKFYLTEPLTKVKTDHTPASEGTTVVSVTSTYPYLMQDVLKVGILTVTIIAVQVILFFLLKKQILVLFMVKY